GEMAALIKSTPAEVKTAETPPEAPQGKVTLTPALLVDGKAVTGGGSHQEIMNSVVAHAKATGKESDFDFAVKVSEANGKDDQHVFILNGDMDHPLSREEARPFLEKITGKPTMEGVQSHHIPDAAKGDTSFKTPSVEPKEPAAAQLPPPKPGTVRLF